ncbi:MAG: hypothetical protein K2J80_08850 [Oscillospiraceae bacterium]|nr:hypothetical protein [Oscillospiraceae bacterium]
MVRKVITPLLDPHIVQTCYDGNGRIIGYIADNYVEHDPVKVREHLDNIVRIWAQEEAKTAAEKVKQAAE